MEPKVSMKLFLFFSALCKHIIFLDGQIIMPDESFTDSDMKQFKDSEQIIYEMQEDLMNDGFILMCSGSQIISTNGSITTVVAGNGTRGYAEGAKDTAMFNEVKDMIQINQTILVVSDSDNHCLRIVDRQRQMTSVYAGSCTVHGRLDGEAKNARFDYPYGILILNECIYVCDFKNDAIRKVNITSMFVSTFVKTMDRPSYILFHSGGYLLVSRYNGFAKVALPTGQTIHMNTAHGAGYNDGALKNALFYSPMGMVWIASDTFLVADVANTVIRVINLTSSHVSTLIFVTGDREPRHVWSLLLHDDTLFTGGADGVMTYKLSRVVQVAVGTNKKSLQTGIIIGTVLLAVTVTIITMIVHRKNRTIRNIDNSTNLLQGQRTMIE